MKNNLFKYYIVVACLCSTLVGFAQPGSNDTGGNLEGGDAPAPIDDYVWVLAIVGLILVFVKFKAMQNKKIKG